ncbi:hypothetical protein I7I51_03719 [Histoplasma capsulatum]|uniref:Uncharacterized protein n=1 Tax=Ajellomyces capsulatus TaxID=5037 RepID=A0A8A1MA98_AJECA|nr:hypothetical protein I7I51_03719 [Histoplasma capsulatum]
MTNTAYFNLANTSFLFSRRLALDPKSIFSHSNWLGTRDVDVLLVYGVLRLTMAAIGSDCKEPQKKYEERHQATDYFSGFTAEVARVMQHLSCHGYRHGYDYGDDEERIRTR